MKNSEKRNGKIAREAGDRKMPENKKAPSRAKVLLISMVVVVLALGLACLIPIRHTVTSDYANGYQGSSVISAPLLGSFHKTIEASMTDNAGNEALSVTEDDTRSSVYVISEATFAASDESRKIVSFDEAGAVTAETVASYDSTGSLTGYSRSVYDDTGEVRALVEASYDDGAQLESKVTDTYTDGRVMQQNGEYYENGALVKSSSIYYYDQGGRSEAWQYYEAGILTGYTDATYDANDAPTFTSENQYDATGNLTETHNIYYEAGVIIKTETYTYYDDHTWDLETGSYEGGILTEQVLDRYGDDGRVTESVVTVYDPEGNVLSVTDSAEEG